MTINIDTTSAPGNTPAAETTATAPGAPSATQGATQPGTTLVPAAAATAPCRLAEQLEAAAAAIRVASFAGFGLPDFVVVTEYGVRAQLSTADLLQFAQLYDSRPVVTAYEGSAYVGTEGEIDGQPWLLHTADEVPDSAPAWSQFDTSRMGADR